MDFEDYARRLSAWQLETFGPGQRLAGVVEHIRSELRELEECNGADLSEWADVIILAINGTWRNGFTASQLSAELERKLAVNRARTWPDWRTIPADQPIEHDRGGETLPAGNAAGAAPEWSSGRGWPTVYGIPMIFTHRPIGGCGECPECGQEAASITVSIAADETSRISTGGAPDSFGRFTVWAFGFTATNSPCCGSPGARLELTQPETQADLTMRVWRAWRGGMAR